MGGLLIPAAVGLAVLTAGWIIYTAVYNLYFHPLAKYPGPRLNAISPIPAIIGLLRGRIALDVKKMHDKYGPVVRVAPTELSFNGANAWEDIYGHRQGLKNMHKDPVHVGSVDPLPGATTLTMADDHNHARQRRALAYSFSQKALLEQEHIVNGYVDIFINKLGKKADNGETFNLVDWLNFTTFDIIGDLAFGEPFGCLKDEAFHDWVALIFESIKVGA
jgi:cytochrome P450